MQYDLYEWDDEVEDEVNVDEFHVGCPRERVRDAYEECRQHQQCGDIHSSYGLKVVFLNILVGVTTRLSNFKLEITQTL